LLLPFVCHSERSEESPHWPLLVFVRHSGAARISVFALALAAVLSEGAGGFSPLKKAKGFNWL
jgi:hypothetical protein